LKNYSDICCFPDNEKKGVYSWWPLPSYTIKSNPGCWTSWQEDWFVEKFTSYWYGKAMPTPPKTWKKRGKRKIFEALEASCENWLSSWV
jgi:hypothetical protein